MVSRACKISVLFTVCIILVGVFPAPAANAQDSRQHSDMMPLLEELVVTARKREETVLDAPLSITALGADQIEARKLRGPHRPGGEHAQRGPG